MSVTRIENQKSQSFIAHRSGLSCAIHGCLCIGPALELTSFAAAAPCVVPGRPPGTVSGVLRSL